VTVSMRVMSAGDGYRYLLKSVAVGDGDRSLSSPLTRYYVEPGTPPGTWMPVTVFGVKPMRRAWRDTSPAGTPLIANLPSSPDWAPIVVPMTCRLTPASPSPDVASTMRPTTRPVEEVALDVCADSTAG